MPHISSFYLFIFINTIPDRSNLIDEKFCYVLLLMVWKGPVHHSGEGMVGLMAAGVMWQGPIMAELEAEWPEVGTTHSESPL